MPAYSITCLRCGKTLACAYLLRTLLVLLAALTGFMLPARAALANLPEVRIAVLAHRGEAAALKNWQPTADYLSQAIPTRRFVIVPLKNATLGPAVAAQEVDFVFNIPNRGTRPGSPDNLDKQPCREGERDQPERRPAAQPEPALLSRFRGVGAGLP